MAKDKIELKNLAIGGALHRSGSIVEVFTYIALWLGIRKVIERINANALTGYPDNVSEFRSYARATAPQTEYR